MTLASGTIPYSYDYGQGPFHVPDPYSSDFPIGPSGILLEQAQFVITAELRKWKKADGLQGSHTLPEFDWFNNSNIAPSIRYEPRANGTNLGNAEGSGCLNFLDHIQQTRNALFTLFFNELNGDTNDDYFIAWLSALYPNNPSGRNGNYSRRLPSQTGVVNYTSLDVLGGSGILFDVDFGELMFNPFPHISTFNLDNAHINDPYEIQTGPLFPCFQKTDGTLVPLTGREPDDINNTFKSYHTLPIGSGTIMINGYCLQAGTKYYLGNNANNFDVTGGGAFTHSALSIRQAGNGGNIPTTRSYITPSAQPSGLYRVATINKRSDFPNTTISSGLVSFWPPLTTYPTSQGYHVFDDALWITDQKIGNTLASNTTIGNGLASGLSMLSPWTFTDMWIRYADLTKFDCLPDAGSTITYRNWPSGDFLVRTGANNIYRFHETIQRPITSTSGQLRLARYNDKLDYLTDITSTSDAATEIGGFDNQFPLGGNTNLIGDTWYDPTTSEHWVSNAINTGSDMWKFDNNFKYINKYIFNLPSGIFNARGVFIGGQHFLYNGEFGPTGATHIKGSGIYPVHIVAEGTAPYNSTTTPPQGGEAYISLPEGKNINGAPFVGTMTSAEIIHIIEVASSTHLTPGVYALIRWVGPSTGAIGKLYLIKIEEKTTEWEVKFAILLENLTVSPFKRRYLLYMPY